ncbi:MAG: FadR family transcriptional regulator, partial [Mesorhizobium sp.]
MNGSAGSGIIPNRARGRLMTKRKPLSTVVAESLSEKIRSGRLPPGAQLP